MVLAWTKKNCVQASDCTAKKSYSPAITSSVPALGTPIFYILGLEPKYVTRCTWF